MVLRDPLCLFRSVMRSMPSVDTIARLMRDTAACCIMPHYRALAADDIREKTGPKDLVTIADIESERRITPLLIDLMPGSVVIGEEAAVEDPGIFRYLTGEAPVWLVDPVDGTGNFAKGGRHFCMMVGLVRRGQPVLGVILDPLGECWVGAERGSGAWRHACDGSDLQRLSVLDSCPVSAMRGALNTRFLESPLKQDVRARARATVARYYSLGCAGHEYLAMVSGEAHFAFHVKTMPWDHVAGCVIHMEAGGYHAHADGSAYLPRNLRGGLLHAPDRASWTQLHRELFGLTGPVL